MAFKFKLGFATDIHGSEYAFKRILNIAKSRNVGYLILSGGLTSKDIIFVEEVSGMYFVNGKKVNLKNLIEDSLKSGKYLIINSREVIENLKKDKNALEKALSEIITEQFSKWINIAEENFGLDKIFWSPAHGDIPQLDYILKKLNANVINENVVNLGEVQIASLGFASPIGNNYREISDSELYIKGKSLLKDAERESLICNFHMPPLNTKIDVIRSGFRKSHIGSKAVLDLINEFQPFVSLHGHVHESAGIEKIGNTIAINPGSLYQLGEPSVAVFEVHKELKGLRELSVTAYVIKNLELVSTNPLDVI
ncbi:MAG: phosphoesterase [Saccharolobus sp.]